MAEEAGGEGERSKPLHTLRRLPSSPLATAGLVCQESFPVQHLLQEEMPGGQREGKRLCAQCQLLALHSLPEGSWAAGTQSVPVLTSRGEGVEDIDGR